MSEEWTKALAEGGVGMGIKKLTRQANISTYVLD